MATDTSSRRDFLKRSAALAALPLIGCAVNSSIDGYALLGAWRTSTANGAGRITPDLKHQTSLPTRGHHIEIIDHNEAWLFARRPSEYMQRVNWRTGQVLHTYRYDSARAGFGHGVMRGNQLLTTDQNLDNDTGILTLRNGATGEVVQEFGSGGIGPHELLLMPDGEYVAIANGGILTRPELGRMKLNVADMQPNISIINARTGQIQSTHTLLDSKMSIRHLAHLPHNRIGIALQYEYDGATHAVPVAAMWRDGQMQILTAPDADLTAAQGYAASAVSGADYFAVSCPKANAVLVWHTDGSWHTTLHIPQAFGLASIPERQRLIVSSENGNVYYINTQTWAEVRLERQSFPVKWDNHLRVFKT